MFFKAEKLFKNVILVVVFLINIITFTYGECTINLSEDISLRPKIKTLIGSRKIDFIFNPAETVLSIFDGQEIEAQCDNKFEEPVRFSAENSIRLQCNERNLYINGDGFDGHYTTLICSSQKWNLYETLPNFVWCPSNTTSYLLARPHGSKTNQFQYLAGLCCDTSTISFKSLFYTIAPKNSKDVHPKFLSDIYKPAMEIKHLKNTFSTKSIRESDFDTQYWIKFSKYNYSSMIQNSLLSNFGQELGSLLDLVWWPSLRLGNWKRYEAALTLQVESQHQSYDVLSGVSSVVSVPVLDKCQPNITSKELVSYTNQKVPLYIWHYLRSRNNSSDEIVIIGVNTPFYEFYVESAIVFCSDMCQDVPWLKDVSKIFRFSPLGIIFCCSSDEVRASKRLDGFPDIDMYGNAINPINNSLIHQKLEDVTNSYESSNNRNGYN